MDLSDLNNLFLEKKNLSTTKKAALEKRFNLISAARLLLGIAIGASLAFLVNGMSPLIFGCASVLFISVFVYMVSWHRKVRSGIVYHTQLIAINENEVRCLHGNYTSNYSGDIYKNASHPYSGDLDVFGKHSLFQSACRASTKGGRTLLAAWLQNAATLREIQFRQEAVKELTEMTSWRQDMEAASRGLSHNTVRGMPDEDVEKLKDWIDSKEAVSSKIIYLIVPLFIISLVTFIAMMSGMAAKWFIFSVILNLVLAGRHKSQISKLRDTTHGQTRFLSSFAGILSCIEQQKFHSSKVVALQEKVGIGAENASGELKK